MNPLSRCPKRTVARGRFQWRRWLPPLAVVLLMPKCVLCALAYLGAGALATGLGEVEWCGGSPGPTSALPSLAAWLGAAALVGAVVIRWRLRRSGTHPAVWGPRPRER